MTLGFCFFHKIDLAGAALISRGRVLFLVKFQLLMNGWLKLHRKILESKQFGNPIELKIWVWLMCKASTQDRNVTLKIGAGLHSVRIKTGQMIFGRSAAERELEIDGSTVYKVIQRLQTNKDILIESNSHFSVITVLNWNDYQSNESIEDFEILEEVTSKEQPNNSNVTGKEQASNSNVTQYKKVKKVDKVKKVEKGGASAQVIFLSPEFKKFIEWIDEHAPSVAKMTEPFTEKQFLDLKKAWPAEKIAGILRDMHNYKPLLRKNKSAYLTASKWLKPKTNGNQINFAGNGAASLGTSSARSEAVKNW